LVLMLQLYYTVGKRKASRLLFYKCQTLGKANDFIAIILEWSISLITDLLIHVL
jgi:hypothetical protein